MQCAIEHYTADERRDVERLYLSEKAKLMAEKIVENLAIAKAVRKSQKLVLKFLGCVC